MRLFYLAKNYWARLTGDNTCWIYLHLPKTAGSSISSALRRQFGGRGARGAFIDRRVNLHEQSLHLLSRSLFRAVSGHFGRIEMERLEAAWPDVRFRYVTFLREPVSRFMSAYRHLIISSSQPPKLEHISVMSDPDILSWLYNTQARQLAYGYAYSDLPSTITDEKIRSRAMETIDRCEFVGFYEHLDRDLPQLYSLLGIRRPAKLPTLNATRHVPYQFDDQDLRTARAFTQIDSQVYAAALQRTQGPPLAQKFQIPPIDP